MYFEWIRIMNEQNCTVGWDLSYLNDELIRCEDSLTLFNFDVNKDQDKNLFLFLWCAQINNSQ